MSDVAVMYRDAQQRIAELVTETNVRTPVPACPDWTVAEVIAHLAGLAEDVVNGQVDGYATAEWTSAQVSKRQGASVDEVLTGWNTSLDAFVEIMDDLEGSELPDLINTAVGPAPKATFRSAFLVDLIQHEHDLRGALVAPRSVVAADVEVLDNQIRNLRAVFAMAQLPTLTVEATDPTGSWAVGRAEPSARVKASTIELLRALGGRRTVIEVEQFEWSGDHDEMPSRFVLPFFRSPTSPIAGG
ncbi:MAG: maleylpyruvate isomerase family mycothiol-dependent enzyme [Acidimicrobiales bacterium]